MATPISYVGTSENADKLSKYSASRFFTREEIQKHLGNAYGLAYDVPISQAKNNAIVLNANAMARSKEFSQRVLADMKQGQFPRLSAGKEYAHVVTHEFGHILDFWLRQHQGSFTATAGGAVEAPGDFGSVFGTLNWWKTKFYRRGGEVSRYADSDKSEALKGWAEPWAESFSKRENAPRLLRFVENGVERTDEWKTFTKSQDKLLTMVEDYMKGKKVTWKGRPQASTFTDPAIRQKHDHETLKNHLWSES